MAKDEKAKFTKPVSPDAAARQRPDDEDVEGHGLIARKPGEDDGAMDIRPAPQARPDTDGTVSRF